MAGLPAASEGGASPAVEAVRPSAPEASQLPVWLWPAALMAAGVGLVTPNPGLTAAGILVVPIIVSLLWRPGELPILLACCLMQWLQVVTPVFDADLVGQSLGVVSGIPQHDKATWLTLVGVVATAVGMRLALKHRLGSVAPQIELELGQVSLPRIFHGYLLGFGVAIVSSSLAWQTGGLGQLILPFALLKWGLLWILISGALIQGRGHGWVVAALALETGFGFLGYFSAFKDAYYVLALAIFSIRKRLSPVTWVGIFATLLGLLTLMIFWQAVKIEYRAFVSRDATDQGVRVSVVERLEKLQELVANLDAAGIEEGITTLVERVGYTELFAATLEWVPAGEPYAGGELWRKALLHPVTPRLLFPDKAVLDDSEVTRRFTGRQVSGSESGTSIGIGYMAESYADFGAFWMFLPLLSLGYVLGQLYRRIVFSGTSRAWGVALALAVLFVTLQGIATAGAKMFGAVLSASLVLFTLNWLVGPTLLGGLGLRARVAPNPDSRPGPGTP